MNACVNALQTAHHDENAWPGRWSILDNPVSLVHVCVLHVYAAPGCLRICHQPAFLPCHGLFYNYYLLLPLGQLPCVVCVPGTHEDSECIKDIVYRMPAVRASSSEQHAFNTPHLV